MSKEINVDEVKKIADDLVSQNIWPSYIKIGKILGIQGKVSVIKRYLKAWKYGIGLKTLTDIEKTKFIREHIYKKNDCGKMCDDYKVIYAERILCPIHYTVQVDTCIRKPQYFTYFDQKKEHKENK